MVHKFCLWDSNEVYLEKKWPNFPNKRNKIVKKCTNRRRRQLVSQYRKGKSKGGAT